MESIRHGLSIGIERINSQFFISLKAVGKLTHDDYKIITPLIDGALTEVENSKANLFVDASELEGWELRAAWDDFKLGLKHNREFKRVAIYGNQKWQANIAKLGSWFISGELKYFDNSGEALDWLSKEHNRCE